MVDFVPFVLIPFLGWGVRRFLIRKNEWTPYKKWTLGIGIVAYFITEVGRSFYRPWIYANDIDDWVVADTLGNSFGTITAVFMIITMAGNGTRKDWRLVGIVLAGLIGYELLDLTGHHPFDGNDLLATVLFGALASITVHRLLDRFGSGESNQSSGS